MGGKQSWKDIVERVAGPEPRPVVYDFSRGQQRSGRVFTEPVNQDGQGVYNDGLVDGGVEGE
jgi:hypothetical protein